MGISSTNNRLEEENTTLPLNQEVSTKDSSGLEDFELIQKSGIFQKLGLVGRYDKRRSKVFSALKTLAEHVLEEDQESPFQASDKKYVKEILSKHFSREKSRIYGWKILGAIPPGECSPKSVWDDMEKGRSFYKKLLLSQDARSNMFEIFTAPPPGPNDAASLSSASKGMRFALKTDETFSEKALSILISLDLDPAQKTNLINNVTSGHINAEGVKKFVAKQEKQRLKREPKWFLPNVFSRVMTRLDAWMPKSFSPLHVGFSDKKTLLVESLQGALETQQPKDSMTQIVGGLRNVAKRGRAGSLSDSRKQLPEETAVVRMRSRSLPPNSTFEDTSFHSQKAVQQQTPKKNSMLKQRSELLNTPTLEDDIDTPTLNNPTSVKQRPNSGRHKFIPRSAGDSPKLLFNVTGTNVGRVIRKAVDQKKPTEPKTIVPN